MNKTISETKQFASDFKKQIKKINMKSDYAIASSYTSLAELGKIIPRASQNISEFDTGAYTGEISSTMLKEVNVKYAIIGHSERRALLGETDKQINLKAKKALNSGITPVICVGESKKEYETKKTNTVTKRQVINALKGLKDAEAEKVIIAYEPVWAIGTGKNATPEIAQKVCEHIRSVISKSFTKDTANKIRIQYGGSVSPKNINKLMEKPDIDGALVGGAALDAITFAKLLAHN